MAKVLNNAKAAAKSRALGYASQAEHEASQLLNEVKQLLMQLDCAVGGAPSGMDRNLIGQCQRAIQDLTSAQRGLMSAMSAISSLDVYDEVPDVYGNGGYR